MPAIVVIADILQIIVPVLSLVAYIPLWKKLCTLRSSKEISLTAWVIWVFSSSFALFYAIIQYSLTGQGIALVFAASAGLLFILITIALILYYRFS